MAEIDLVPLSYRRLRRTKGWLKLFGIAYGAVLACLIAGKALFAYGITVRTVELEKLDADRAQVAQRKATLEELQATREVLERKAKTLEALRSGPDPRAIFVAVDRALDNQVWFLEWTFRRAGEFVPAEPKTVNTGYFITVPVGEHSSETKAWQMATHMEIKAQASDHSTLAEFVQRLNGQPVVEEVKVLNTRMHSYESTQVVDFTLAVVIGG
ncbi:MAG: hypothetical protein GWN84_17140 [Gammaproteobacteria bacterium]|nr:hypothetical protein [Gammaproteobacteria bacterium]NIR84563.1 hypothetical protein [Gammaproteobacteria bacterium]NIR90466.1 hypothetical protein [Gammaproteobacteria bacterium]NIU05614.1 hypothetical protein [Gammaproteobacteria bacterium]NIV52753.1 hypothetical protein [Gammaproteobacteria bacterium]